jgi:hypothetical protein
MRLKVEGILLRLATITNNHISFECKCGHTSLIPVTAFIEKFGRKAEVSAVVAKACCSCCRIKNNAESGIVFVGGGRVRQCFELPQSNHTRNTHEKKKNHFHCSDAPWQLRTQLGVVHPAATEVVFLKANFTLLNYLEARVSSSSLL